LPNQSTLSANVIVESEEILGEGTFGVVKVGFYQTLGVKCAIKAGKNSLFNAKLECQIMQRFHGSLYFPFVFGVFDNKLVMELIVDDNDNVKTIYSARSSSELEQHEWTDICKDLAEALFFLHSNGFLHNDIKTNNIMLKKNNKMHYFPKIIDMGKVTTRSEPHRYRLNERQKLKYNKKYSYLAPEIRNVFDTSTCTLTDIYSMGVVVDFVADEDNLVLQTIAKRMLSVKPTDRPNTFQIVKHFKNYSSK